MVKDKAGTDDPSVTEDPGRQEPFDVMAYVNSPEYLDYIRRVQSFDDPSQGCWLRRKATQLLIRLIAPR